jgi:hypothetical protein
MFDPYWIAERYHGARTMPEFIKYLHDYGVPEDVSKVVWKIIDATVDITPDRAADKGSAGLQPLTHAAENGEAPLPAGA